jgi:alpha-mannosidase
MRLTLIKSAIEPDPNADIGNHSFSYSLYPHKGNWQIGNTVKMAYQFNYDLLTRLKSGKQKVDMADEFSFAQVDKDNVIIETVKKAEQGNAIVIRVYEIHNSRGQVELKFSYPIRNAKECNLIEQEPKAIEFSDKQVRFQIKPYEIKTFLVDFEV